MNAIISKRLGSQTTDSTVFVERENCCVGNALLGHGRKPSRCGEALC